MYLFLLGPAQGSGVLADLAPTYKWSLWRPSLRNPIPPGPKGLALFIWWLLHAFRVFSNRDYSALIVNMDGRTVHRSCVFPRYFRFPFMSATDLQIGDTWTCPSERGKGVATFALKAIVECHAAHGRKLWYLVEDGNQPSVRVAEKAGFSEAGYGCRTRRFGLRILGQYVLTDRSQWTC